MWGRVIEFRSNGSMDRTQAFAFVPGLVLLVVTSLSGQPVTVSAPPDQRLGASEYTNRNTNQLLDKSTEWEARANKFRNAVFTLEAPSFKHQSISAERPTRLHLTASKANKWTVTTSTDSSQDGEAEVKAVKNGKGGGKARFNLNVYFLEETTDHVAPAGTYQMSVTGTISAGP